MMIVDNTAHFQPYTFERIASHHSSGQCIGANMPVFKFQMQPDGKPFEILEDNFSKLWTTSNIDLFHVEARIADRNRIMKDIFDFHFLRIKSFKIKRIVEGTQPIIGLQANLEGERRN
jgi:hypothetical protein